MNKTSSKGKDEKRILMISTHGYFEAQPSYGLPDTGGQVAYVIELSLALAILGYQVDILTRQFSDFPQHEEVGENVRIIRVPCGGRDFIPKEYLAEYLPDLVSSFVQYCSANSLKYDFIDSHYWDAGFVGMKLAESFSIPHIFTPHSVGFWKKMQMEQAAVEQGTTLNEDELEEHHNFKQRIKTEKTIMTLANQVIATSPHQKDIITGNYCIPEEKTDVITPGFDPEKYCRIDGNSLKKAVARHGLPARFILAVGRITEYKGHDLLIEAMKHVCREIPDVKLVLRIGSKELHEDEAKKINELLQVVRKLDMAERVLFYDYVEDIESFYRAAEVFVLPSTYEPFGMVAIEAMACGTPAVLTTKGGLRDLLEDEKDALFVNPVDTEAMAKSIVRLLQDKSLHEDISRNGYNKAHTCFTWDNIARRILETVEQLEV